MDSRAGVVEGYFTPLAAQIAARAVAHLTPGESAALFARMGGMCPSKARHVAVKLAHREMPRASGRSPGENCEQALTG